MKSISKILIPVVIISIVLLYFTSVTFAEESALEVLELVVARDVVEREPVDPADTFSADVHKLYCFSKVKVNVEASTIYHSWYYNDEKVTQIELNVKKSPGFRTYSNKTIGENQKGKWEVEVQDSDGNILQSVTFTIK